MVGVTAPAFHDLMTREFGIKLTQIETAEIFKRFGKETPVGYMLNVDHYISRMIRNEASVGNWSGVDKQPVGLHLGVSVDLREDDMKARSSFKKRAGGVPLCVTLAWEDSKKLLSFNREMVNFDGTISNLNPNRLGDADNHLGVALCPEFKPRHPMQRIGRACQPSHMGANDQWNDSTLVRGYADVWVPPCGPGAWDVEPTHGGDAFKIGETPSRPGTKVSRGRTPPGEETASKRVFAMERSMKPPNESMLMISHQAAVSPGIMLRGATASTTKSRRRGAPMLTGRSRSNMDMSPSRSCNSKPILFDRKTRVKTPAFDLRSELFSRSGTSTRR